MKRSVPLLAASVLLLAGCAATPPAEDDGTIRIVASTNVYGDLAMTIGTYGRTARVYNLLSLCERFGLTNELAKVQIDRLVATLRDWRDHFRACGVSAKDIDYIAPALLPECFFFERPVEAH